MGGKTSNESKAKYNAKAYDRINIAIPKGQKEKIQKAASKVGESINSYVSKAISERMERDVDDGDEDTDLLWSVAYNASWRLLSR